MMKAKSLASALALATLMTLTTAAPALADAQPRYDRSIEQAAIRMLQPKLGELRGALDLDTETHLFPRLSRRLVDGGQAKWPEPSPVGQIEGSLIRY